MPLEFWFEFASTYSYPAALRVEDVARARGVDLVWSPFLLGPIFKDQGWNDSPFNLYPAKGRYMWRDLERTCAELGFPFRRPSRFSRPSLLAARVACRFAAEAVASNFVRSVYRASFAEDLEIGDAKVVADRLDALGLPSAALVDEAQSAESKEALRAKTERSGSASSAPRASSRTASSSGATTGWRRPSSGAPPARKPPPRPADESGVRASEPPIPDREFRFGDGRLSGGLSLGLGLLALLAVLCFRFPEWLTTPELRAVYPLGLVRGVLFAALVLSLAALSLALGGRRWLGWGGLASTAAAITLGGAWVDARPVERSPHLGLDWFVLDLLVLALVFVPLERALALVREQRVLRTGWKTDLAHFLASHLLVQVLALLTITPAAVLFVGVVSPELQGAVAAQPLVLQVIEAIVVADLFQYAVHRAFHAVPFLWRFHAVHHSSTSMDWLAGSRLHLVDVVVTRATTFIPLFVLGFAQPALVAYLVFVAFQAVFLHANVRLRFRWLRWILATPEFHHWHHAAEAEAVDRNFAVHLPAIDRSFGTAWLPDRWPARYGVAGNPVPDGWWPQLVWPFSREG